MKRIVILIVLMSLCFGLWGADSTRTRAELETIFGDAADVITKQDIRDLITSLYLQSEISGILNASLYRAVVDVTFEQGTATTVEHELIDSLNITLDDSSDDDGTLIFETSGTWDTNTLYLNAFLSDQDETETTNVYYEFRRSTDSTVTFSVWTNDVKEFPADISYWMFEIKKY